MQPKDLLPCSQEYTMGPCAETGESGIHLNIILLHTSWSPPPPLPPHPHTKNHIRIFPALDVTNTAIVQYRTSVYIRHSVRRMDRAVIRLCS
jgi:hypothetical protein